MESPVKFLKILRWASLLHRQCASLVWARLMEAGLQTADDKDHMSNLQTLRAVWVQSC